VVELNYMKKKSKNIPVDKYIKVLKKFPLKRVAVGVLIFNNKGQILLLEPSYKDWWTLPGGVVDEFESPTKAAVREVREEIGIKMKMKKCIAVDYLKYRLKNNYTDESLQIIFLGEKLTIKTVKNIKLDKKEITDFKFVDFKDALKLLNRRLSNRLKGINEDYNNFHLLENGKRVY
jgi:8-oxo-dGTP diphosphatase